MNRTENIKRWKREHPERVREHTARFHARHPGRKKQYERAEYRRDIEKSRARSRLTSAVHRGTVVKPDACEKCGCPCEPRELHGHHRDYSKPFEVDWLCAECHRGEHHE